MENKVKKQLMKGSVLFLLFVLFTIAVKMIDVQPIGPESSTVGFASLNRWVFEATGVNLFWYHLTDWLGILAILVAGYYAVKGFLQLVMRKSLFKVDKSIVGMGVLYVVVLAFYVLFEKVIINYRPILMDGYLEASYPSSHTMLVFCLLMAAIVQLKSEGSSKSRMLTIFYLAIVLVTIVGRLLSGVHWFTDITGGILLSAALVQLYKTWIIQIAREK